jgi:hypothetical protein
MSAAYTNSRYQRTRGGSSHHQRLIRRGGRVRGQMYVELECAPRFGYGRERHDLERHAHGAAALISSAINLD